MTKHFGKLALWFLKWWIWLYFHILGPASLWHSLTPKPPQSWRGADTRASPAWKGLWETNCLRTWMVTVTGLSKLECSLWRRALLFQTPHSADEVELLQLARELLSCLPLGYVSKGGFFPRSHRLQEEKARVRVTKRYLISGTTWFHRMSTFIRTQRVCLGCSCPGVWASWLCVEASLPCRPKKVWAYQFQISCPVPWLRDQSQPDGLERGEVWLSNPFWDLELNPSQSGQVLHLIKEFEGSLFFFLPLHMRVLIPTFRTWRKVSCRPSLKQAKPW